jgi:ATP-dependent Clp protease adaptor protein ClpS
MIDEQPNRDGNREPAESEGGTAVLPAPPKVRRLPTWRVLLHNDDVNTVVYVVHTILELTALVREEATHCMLEAHRRGVSLLLTTHREHAELLEEQFRSKRLTVTIEPE